jgi:hypothetical protein
VKRGKEEESNTGSRERRSCLSFMLEGFQPYSGIAVWNATRSAFFTTCTPVRHARNATRFAFSSKHHAEGLSWHPRLISALSERVAFPVSNVVWLTLLFSHTVRPAGTNGDYAELFTSEVLRLGRLEPRPTAPTARRLTPPH